jgi:hypothetical protein
MALADLFNPTFLIFLGILMLVVAFLIVYFENKMREQNHKIASMLSLVSTLADDMNGVKMGLNHLAIRGGQGFQNPNMSLSNSNLGTSSTIQSNDERLIEVSDNDSEDDENDYDESVEELELESENDDDDDDDDDNDNIKVIKLNVSNEDTEDNNDSIEFDEADDDEVEELADEVDEVDEVEDLADINDELPEIDDNYVEQVLDLKYEEKDDVNNTNNTKDSKTISINLGDEESVTKEKIDYKKLQITKLRSIAVEKGVTSNSEVNKLKKTEILKLLGAE